MTSANRRQAWGGLVAVLILAAALRLLFFGGLQLKDDVRYLTAAHRLYEGRWEAPTDAFSARWGFLLPIWAAMKLGGASFASATMIPLLGSLMGVACAWALGWRWGGARIAWPAALWLVCFPIDIYLSTFEMHTDTWLAGGLAVAALAWLWNGWEDPTGPGRAFATGLVIGLAYWIKEPAPLFLGLPLLHAALQRGRRREIPWLLAGVLGPLAVEPVLYAAWTGDPWLRVHVVQADHFARLETYFTGRETIFSRLFIEVPLSLLWTYRGSEILQFSASYWIVLAAAVWALAKRDRAAWRTLAWWLLACFLLEGLPRDWSFRPINTIAARHFVPLAVPAALLVGQAASRLSPGLPRRAAYAAFGLGLVVNLAGAGLVHLEKPLTTEGLVAAADFVRASPERRAFLDPWSAQGLEILSDWREPWTERIWDPEDPPPPGSLVLVNRHRVYANEHYAGIPPPSWLDVLLERGERLFQAVPRRRVSLRRIASIESWRAGFREPASPHYAVEVWRVP